MRNSGLLMKQSAENLSHPAKGRPEKCASSKGAALQKKEKREGVIIFKREGENQLLHLIFWYYNNMVSIINRGQIKKNI